MPHKKGGRGEPPERKAHSMGLSVGRMDALSAKESPIWIPPEPDANLRLRKASEEWVAHKSLFVGPKTLTHYRYSSKTLLKFFGDIKLTDITIHHFRRHQVMRRQLGVGPVAINHELGTLRQILRFFGLWRDSISQFYKQLRMDRVGPGVALTEEQTEQLFRVAFDKYNNCSTRQRGYWEVAIWASLLSVNTSAGPGEIRYLRLQDIDLNENAPKIYINRGKNHFRLREIPLNPVALMAAKKLLERARRIGCCQPEHYLLPARRSGRMQPDYVVPVRVPLPAEQPQPKPKRTHVRMPKGEPRLPFRYSGKKIDLELAHRLRYQQRLPWRVVADQVGLTVVNLRRRMVERKAGDEKNSYNLNMPQRDWKTAWNKMRKAIGLPTLRVYDLRHTCITRLLSNPDVPERVVIETVGHVNSNMLHRYSHQRLEDKAKALGTLAPAYDFMAAVQA
jgi:integrase